MGGGAALEMEATKLVLAGESQSVGISKHARRAS